MRLIIALALIPAGAAYSTGAERRNNLRSIPPVNPSLLNGW
jgi:hypothetical protein